MIEVNIIDEYGMAVSVNLISVDSEYFWTYNKFGDKSRTFFKVNGFFERTTLSITRGEVIFAASCVYDDELVIFRESDLDYVEENPIIDCWAWVYCRPEPIQYKPRSRWGSWFARK